MTQGKPWHVEAAEWFARVGDSDGDNNDQRLLRAALAERQALLGELSMLHTYYRAALDRLATAFTQADLLRLALRRYGEHDGANRGGYSDPDPDDCLAACSDTATCTCGYTAALDAALGPEGER